MPGYYTRSGDVAPTLNETTMSNFEFVGTFTADPSTDLLTVSAPHMQITAEVVLVHSTGTLPGGLVVGTFYRVLSAGLGTNTLKLGSNVGWNPPPENPPIDITDTGTGTHGLYIRPLAYVGPFIPVPSGLMSTEGVGGARGCLYWGNPPRSQNDMARFQVKGASLPSGLAQNVDYYTGAYQRPPAVPFSRWSVGGVTVGGSGSGDIWSYFEGVDVIGGQGDLGSVTAENYYLISGDVSIIIIGGGGGEGGLAQGGPPVTVELPRPTIKVRDPELASILRRARRAARIIEDLSIVGASGDSESGFSL